MKAEFILSEASQKEKKKIPCAVTDRWNLKYDRNELTYKPHQGHGCQGGGKVGGSGLADAEIMYRMDKQQEPAVTTGNYIQHPGINHSGRNIKNGPGKTLRMDTFPGVQTLVLEPHLPVPSKRRV